MLLLSLDFGFQRVKVFELIEEYLKFLLINFSDLPSQSYDNGAKMRDKYIRLKQEKLKEKLKSNL